MLLFSNFSKNSIMENIIEPNSEYNFDEMGLDTPNPLQGGSFYTKISHTSKKLPLYVQLPKCKTKNGITRNSSLKKSYCDLMFSTYDTELITWMENLESKCRDLIFNKKDIWFQNEMTLDDIENVFISPMKSYKSGKFIIIRAHIPSTKQIRRESCMIYDENEQILEMSDIKDTMEIIPLVYINGIKFSSKSFQLDISLPQLMVISVQDSIKNEFMIKHEKSINKSGSLEINNEDIKNNDLDKVDENIDKILESNKDGEREELAIMENEKGEQLGIIEDEEREELGGNGKEGNEKLKSNELLGLKEIELNVANIKDSVSIKKPNEVYFGIYRAAREKARHMRQAAIEAYLEARNIKTKYMLDDMDDSDDNMSNLSIDEEEEKPN